MGFWIFKMRLIFRFSGQDMLGHPSFQVDVNRLIADEPLISPKTYSELVDRLVSTFTLFWFHISQKRSTFTFVSLQISRTDAKGFERMVREYVIARERRE